MRIKRLELTNFRCFEHLVIDDVPNVVALVARNRAGKSSILDAILGAKEIARPYFADSWNQAEAYKSRHALKWPHQNRPPLRLCALQGKVQIEFLPSEAEVSYLEKKKISPECGVSVTIERDNLIVEHVVTPAGRELLGYNSPASGIGFLDAFGATRFFPPTQIGALSSALSDQNIRSSLGGFHLDSFNQTKWTHFKSFVAAMEMSDTSHRKQTGEDRDSMEAFRQAFDAMFHPKKFVGIVVNTNGEADVCVETPSGVHDIDLLSDGEKELVYILGHLFRFKTLENIILWDTPEAHLNATLESRFVPTIQRVGPKNQYIIATHSIEMIASVDLESVVVLAQSDRGVVCERPVGRSRKERIRTYEALGASVAIQLASQLIIFVEGSETNADKALLDKVFADRLPGCSFVASQDSGKTLASGERLDAVLKEMSGAAGVGMLIDRDYRTDDAVMKLQKRHHGLFVWPVHEVENLLLDSTLLQIALAEIGSSSSQEFVNQMLREAAEEIRVWAAADWVAWELEHAASVPSRWLPKDNPVGALNDYVLRLGERAKCIQPGETVDGLETVSIA